LNELFFGRIINHGGLHKKPLQTTLNNGATFVVLMQHHDENNQVVVVNIGKVLLCNNTDSRGSVPTNGRDEVSIPCLS